MADVTPLILLNLVVLFIVFVDCDMEPFIVEGEIAHIKNFPHSVFMNVFCVDRTGEMKPWICGASILTRTVTLTVAHCVAGCDTLSTISVTVGSRNTKQGSVHSVSNYIIHENFRAERLAYDVAIMLLYTPLKFSDYVKRVALMVNPPHFDTALVAGFGDTEDYLRDGSDLMFIEQYVWKHEHCKTVHRRLPDGTLCASSTNVDSTTSGGDSGSALVVRGYIQIGIVSYKVPSVSRSLVVYTDTGYFYDWITRNTKRLYCAK